LISSILRTPNIKEKLTKDEMDKMVFKVLSLRNIKKTGPYFHDGSVATIDGAIRNMAVSSAWSHFDGQKVKSIEAWMNSLTGQIPASYIKPPELPKSTTQTPPPVGE
jgi:cytochrome c peroxidase